MVGCDLAATVAAVVVAVVIISVIIVIFITVTITVTITIAIITTVDPIQKLIRALLLLALNTNKKKTQHLPPSRIIQANPTQRNLRRHLAKEEEMLLQHGKPEIIILNSKRHLLRNPSLTGRIPKADHPSPLAGHVSRPAPLQQAREEVHADDGIMHVLLAVVQAPGDELLRHAQWPSTHPFVDLRVAAEPGRSDVDEALVVRALEPDVQQLIHRRTHEPGMDDFPEQAYGKIVHRLLRAVVQDARDVADRAQRRQVRDQRHEAQR